MTPTVPGSIDHPLGKTPPSDHLAPHSETPRASPPRRPGDIPSEWSRHRVSAPLEHQESVVIVMQEQVVTRHSGPAQTGQERKVPTILSERLRRLHAGIPHRRVQPVVGVPPIPVYLISHGLE